MLNIAVIGAGAIGRIHARNLARHAGARLSAVYDINPEAAVTVAEEHGASAATSLDDALGDTMDAVIIASSTASHGDVARACVAAGKPFLCEKPLASDHPAGAAYSGRPAEVAASCSDHLVGAACLGRPAGVACSGHLLGAACLGRPPAVACLDRQSEVAYWGHQLGAA